MTSTQQAALEQAAREFLTDDKNEFDLSSTGEPYRFQVEALTTLLATERATVLEEVAKLAEAKADRAKLKSVEQYNHGYRGGLCGFAYELRQQAQEQRP